MRKSKYVGMKSGDWKCINYGVARVQPAFHLNGRDENGKKLRSVSAGHRQYDYLWERLTSDGKAMKTIKLNALQVRQVLDGKYDVEHFAKRKEAKRSLSIKDRVNYCFCD